MRKLFVGSLEGFDVRAVETYSSTDLKSAIKAVGTGAGDLGAFLTPEPVYCDSTHIWLKSYRTVFIGTESGIDFYKWGVPLYGGIRDLCAQISTFVNIVDLGAEIGVHLPSELPAFAGGHLPANLPAQISGAMSSGELPLYAYAGGHLSGKLGVIVKGTVSVYQDLGAELSVWDQKDLYGWIAGHPGTDLRASIIPFVEAGIDLRAYIKSIVSASEGLSAGIGGQEPADLPSMIFVFRKPELPAWIKGWKREEPEDIAASINQVWMDNLSAFLGILEIANLQAEILGELWKRNLYAVVGVHAPADLPGRILGHLGALLPAKVIGTWPYEIRGIVKSIRSDWLNLEARMRGHSEETYDLPAFFKFVLPNSNDLSVCATPIHSVFNDARSCIKSIHKEQADVGAKTAGHAPSDMTAGITAKFALETECPPELDYCIRDLPLNIASSGGWNNLFGTATPLHESLSDLGVNLYGWGKTDLSASLRWLSVNNLSAVIGAKSADTILNLYAHIGGFSWSGLPAAIRSTGGHVDLWSGIYSSGGFFNLGAAIASRTYYITGIIPIDTMCHFDLTANIGWIPCEGGSAFGDLGAVINYLYFRALDARISSFKEGSTDLGAHVNVPFPYSLDKIEVNFISRPDSLHYDTIYLNFVGEAFNRAFDTVPIFFKTTRRFIFGGLSNLSASIGGTSRYSDLSAGVEIDKLWPPQLEESVRIKFYDPHNPLRHKIIDLVFSEGIDEYIYQQASNIVAKANQNARWVIEVSAYRESEILQPAKEGVKNRHVFNLSRYDSVDEGIRHAIEMVVEGAASMLGAAIAGVGGSSFLSVSISSWSSHKSSVLSGLVFSVGNDPVLSASIIPCGGYAGLLSEIKSIQRAGVDLGAQLSIWDETDISAELTAV